MRTAQKIELKRSNLREQIIELSGKDDRSAEENNQLDKLNNDYLSTEVELRSAIALNDYSTTTADRAFNTLEDRASAIEECWLLNILNGKTPTGAIAEYRQELKLEDDEIDLNLLLDFNSEDRADVATPGVNAKTNAAAITPRVFKPTVLSALGISSELVSPAEMKYPVLTGGTTTAMTADDIARESTAGSFSVVALEPLQARGRTTMRTRQLAIFPQFEAALRRDLGRQIDDVVSDQIINGTGTAPQVQGLSAALPAVSTPTGNPANFANFVSLLVEMIDGIYATSFNDLRLLLGVELWKQAAEAKKSDESDLYALDYLNAKARSTNLSAFIPAPATTGDEEDGQRVFATRARGLAGSYGFPMWRNVSMIRDNLSDAHRGWVHITAILNFNFQITRTDNFVRTTLRTS